MSGFAPKFCPTHLQIHVCELQNVFEKNKKIEDKLSAKVRRLHGTQTEEELAIEKSKRKDKEGTLGDILAKAKKKIKADKEALAKNDVETKPASEEEIGDRMAALRAKMSGEPSSSPISDNSKMSVVEETGLQKIINHAKNHQNNHPQENFKTPQRAKTGEKQQNSTLKNNKPSQVSKDLNLNKIEAKNTDLEQKAIKKETKSLKKQSSVKMFSQKEAEELIQIAVKEALKQVGVFEEDKFDIKDNDQKSLVKQSVSKKINNVKRSTSDNKTKSTNKTVKKDKK
ncbi:hypothetical protein [Spiroplasma floricola]|uniref:Uncharacterized protein n=1 Tax=Spiroplasma floricola 23-6 TaxID=1336749 RepID=A0A2K8SDW4_9MOLU|nr:hypothetical protein [Spiroplasma floricola]AUB31654.1 hypothetical protein SFLOR_v1c06020 [Spiroplasma floricola 23-6]